MSGRLTWGIMEPGTNKGGLPVKSQHAHRHWVWKVSPLCTFLDTWHYVLQTIVSHVCHETPSITLTLTLIIKWTCQARYNKFDQLVLSCSSDSLVKLWKVHGVVPTSDQRVVEDVQLKKKSSLTLICPFFCPFFRPCATPKIRWNTQAIVCHKTMLIPHVRTTYSDLSVSPKCRNRSTYAISLWWRFGGFFIIHVQ